MCPHYTVWIIFGSYHGIQGFLSPVLLVARETLRRRNIQLIISVVTSDQEYDDGDLVDICSSFKFLLVIPFNLKF